MPDVDPSGAAGMCAEDLAVWTVGWEEKVYTEDCATVNVGNELSTRHFPVTVNLRAMLLYGCGDYPGQGGASG